MNSDTLAQDLVNHGDKQFFVSTINRARSRVGGYGGRYAETLVWEWYADREGNDKRGNIVGQDESDEYSIAGHKRMCTMFEAHGKQLEDDTARLFMRI